MGVGGVCLAYSKKKIHSMEESGELLRKAENWYVLQTFIFLYLELKM